MEEGRIRYSVLFIVMAGFPAASGKCVEEGLGNLPPPWYRMTTIPKSLTDSLNSELHE